MERSQDYNTTPKRDMKDIKNYRPISLLSHMYKLFTRILQKRMEKVVDKNLPIEQAGFRKGYSTFDHLQTVTQLIEKCNEFKRPLCIGYIDYERAFGSIEHEAIFKALRSIGINETYTRILEDSYTGAAAKVRMDNQVSEEISILRGVSCHTSNRTCKNHQAGHSTRWEETRQTEEMLARQHQGMDGAASRQDPENSRGQ